MTSVRLIGCLSEMFYRRDSIPVNAGGAWKVLVPSMSVAAARFLRVRCEESCLPSLGPKLGSGLLLPGELRRASLRPAGISLTAVLEGTSPADALAGGFPDLTTFTTRRMR